MADDTDKTARDSDDEKSLAKLMKLAGERAEIPLSIESRVYNRVQEEWRNSSTQASGDKSYEKVHKSWRRSAVHKTLFRWLLPVSVAATVMIAVLVNTQPPVLSPPAVATVSRVVASGPLGERFAEGTAVHAGELVSTGTNEGLSLLLARGESLRIDQNTQIQVDATDRFTLLAGRVYADTGLYVFRDSGLTIETSLGVVTDVGTQFSVATNDRSLDVAVREGRVDIRNGSDQFAARVGERLTLVAGQGAKVGMIDVHDEYWSWTAVLAPEFDTSNSSLLDFLKWAARETGRELQFDSDETRMFAMRTDISGSTVGLTPDEALQSVLAVTTVHYQIETGKILIEK